MEAKKALTPSETIQYIHEHHTDVLQYSIYGHKLITYLLPDGSPAACCITNQKTPQVKKLKFKNHDERATFFEEFIAIADSKYEIHGTPLFVLNQVKVGSVFYTFNHDRLHTATFYQVITKPTDNIVVIRKINQQNFNPDKVSNQFNTFPLIDNFMPDSYLCRRAIGCVCNAPVIHLTPHLRAELYNHQKEVESAQRIAAYFSK